MKKTFVLALAYGIVIAGFAVAGDAAADKKKAAEDRKKAGELAQKAADAHKKAVADFDAAVLLQITADADSAEAAALYAQAALLDKDAAKDITIEHLKHRIAAEELYVTYWKNAVKHCQDRAKGLDKSIASEEKSIADLKAAEGAEKDANSKKAEAALVASDEQDLSNLKAALKKDQDDEKADGTQLQNHEKQLENLKKQLKEAGG
jgi:hypothetical protein